MPRRIIASLSLGALCFFLGPIAGAGATIYTIDQTFDLSTASLNLGELASAPFSGFPAFTLAAGDEVDYNVTFTHGKLIAGVAGAGLPHDVYEIDGFLSGPGANNVRCYSGHSSVTLGLVTQSDHGFTTCQGFFWLAAFIDPGAIEGFSGKMMVDSISSLDPTALDLSFNNASFLIAPNFDDATPLRIELDATPVPEPASMALLTVGLTIVASSHFAARRRAAQRTEILP